MAARVVEVIADLGAEVHPRFRYGSGFIVLGAMVLTAAHVVAGAESVSVRDPDKRMFPASCDPRFTGDVHGPAPDLALLEIDHPELDLPPVGLARVDRDSPTGKPVNDCQVIGYPAFMEHDAPEGGQVRETADASGHVPVLARLAVGLLSVQVTHSPRALPPGGRALGESEWSGMSGAPVLAGGLLLGVVTEHATREGPSAITAIPLTALEADPAHPGWGPGVPDPAAWWNRLGVSGIGSLRRLPPRPGRVSEAVAGRLLREVTDPFALEVHRPVRLEDGRPGLPVLPAYLPRSHDSELARVVQAAAKGRSGVAVLVGGSSTGKTRACWQALDLLRGQARRWRLWHPIDPSRPDAALRELPTIGPRTVVWLNEAQFYLSPADGTGERVAAGLRELLRDPSRVPVLVLATLWPQFWDTLTAQPPAGQADSHAHARELLAGNDITVPPAFTTAQLHQARQSGDPRLAVAAVGAEGGQVVQFLAGAPDLLARYRHAPPAARALIDAATDARRLGAGVGLPQALLEAAAPGYLTDAEWDALGEHWLEQALAYTAVPCKGARGPLTRIRPRPGRSSTAGPGSRNNDGQLADGQASIPRGPLYRLADYLDQYGRAHRKGQFPPASFWAAAAGHASPGDQVALGGAARARGLYRDAAQLYHKAAAANVLLNKPGAVTTLLNCLREAGAERQFTVLADRAAAHVPLDDPDAVTKLLNSLREAGAERQFTVLADRAAAHVPLDDPDAVTTLLNSMRQAGMQDQVAALLRRDPGGHASLDDPNAVAWLLVGLGREDAQNQVTVLADRAAAHFPLDNPGAVGALLNCLRNAGAEEQQVAALLRRDPAGHASLDNPGAVAMLLSALGWAGAEQQVTALLRRDPAGHASLDDLYVVAGLLDTLRNAGTQDQVTALADRAAAHVPLDDPHAVAWLLHSLRRAGAEQQFTVLADRAAAHVPLDDPGAVASLLSSLREASAEQQITALLRRDPVAQVSLDNPSTVARLLDSLRRDPADYLDDPAAVAAWRSGLREAGAEQQVTAVLRRDPAGQVSLDDPGAVARLLDSLRRRAQDQVAVLVGRLPGAGMFKLFREQEDRRDRFRFGREADGSPAKPWDWKDLD